MSSQLSVASRLAAAVRDNDCTELYNLIHGGSAVRRLVKQEELDRALWLAATQQRTECARLLLESGASVNVRYTFDRTLLWVCFCEC